MWGTDSQPTPIEAVSTVIGTRAMGTGFNRLMTIQVPMKQHTVRPMTTSPFIGLTMGGMDANGTTGSGFGPPAGVGFPKAVPMCAFGAAAPQAQAMPMGLSGFAAPGGVNASSAHIESESSAHIANESSAHRETASSAHKERSSAHIDAGNQPSGLVGVGWGGWGGWGGVGWDDNVHVPMHTQAQQPHHLSSRRAETGTALS